MSEGLVKRCPRCGMTKDPDQFSSDRWRRDGLASKCRPCDAEVSRDYYARNRDKRVAYFAANGKRIAAREAGRPELLERRRKRNRERTRVRYSEDRASAIAIYGGVCVWCGSTESLEFDHVKGDGGLHRQLEAREAMHRRIVATGVLDDVELQLLCSPCHKRKTAAGRWVAREMERAVIR